MSSYEGWFVKIGVVFHALCFENEVGDPPPIFFFSFLTQVTHDLTVVKYEKNLCSRRFSRERP